MAEAGASRRRQRTDRAQALAAQKARRGNETARFGVRVKELRLAAGLRQDELAEIVGLSRTSISHIETGRREVGVSHVKDLASALGVSPGDLFTS